MSIVNNFNITKLSMYEIENMVNNKYIWKDNLKILKLRLDMNHFEDVLSDLSNTIISHPCEYTN